MDRFYSPELPKAATGHYKCHDCGATLEERGMIECGGFDADEEPEECPECESSNIGYLYAEKE